MTFRVLTQLDQYTRPRRSAMTTTQAARGIDYKNDRR
jgi:hypothetical protein